MLEEFNRKALVLYLLDIHDESLLARVDHTALSTLGGFDARLVPLTLRPNVLSAAPRCQRGQQHRAPLVLAQCIYML